ncbi:MAG TPA: ankyrin repeat domain-containing protein [Victivallales bacterium]|nr:ankyrin repeat domain-containing protein [Victivallales bacterium]
MNNCKIAFINLKYILTCILFVFFTLTFSGCSDPDTSSFMKAAHDGNIVEIKQYISSGTDINRKDTEGNTALIYALSRGLNIYGQKSNDINVIKYLINNGSNVNLANNLGNTPLMYAAIIGNKKALLLLVEKGADIHLKNNNGNTALFLASAAGQTHDAVLPLLKLKADINAKDNAGLTPYTAAVYWRELNTIKEIKNHTKQNNIYLETSEYDYYPTKTYGLFENSTSNSDYSMSR